MAGTRRKPGLLREQVEGYRSWLSERGYPAVTVKNELSILGQVGRWLADEGLQPAELGQDRARAFIAARKAAGFRHVPGPRGMQPLLRFLKDTGVVTESDPIALTPVGELLERYRSWMIQERGLAAATVLRYENTARQFLQEQASDGRLQVHPGRPHGR